MAYLKKILKDDEEVVRTIRRYPLSFLWSMILALILICLPFFLMFPLFRWQHWGLLIFGFLLLVALLYCLRVFVSWYFNTFIITNRRVIDISQKGFFERTVSSASYSRIRDVAFKTRGLFQTIFHYGTVIIEIAGTKVRLEVKNIKNPQEIQDIIVNLEKMSQESESDDRFKDLIEQLKGKMETTEIPVRIKKNN